MNHRITGVAESRSGWRVLSTPPAKATFDILVNALWEGRAAVDATAGVIDYEPWSYRYRLSLFATAARECDLPSTLVATGPFGDIKNYNGLDLYLSWYPAGLLIECTDMAGRGAPAIDAMSEKAVVERTLSGLAPYIPNLRLALEGAKLKVGGGWIVAPGGGSLADAASRLHRRDRFGVRRSGSIFRSIPASIRRLRGSRNGSPKKCWAKIALVGWAKKNLSPKAGERFLESTQQLLKAT